MRVERLLQCTSREFDLRFGFAARDRLDGGQIQLQRQAASGGGFSPLRAGALHLLGHYLAQGVSAGREAEREERSGKPLFCVLWHALEDARVENRMVECWPGMRRSFEARMPRNLGGSLLRVMAFETQLSLGLYLEGRGYLGAQYHPRVGSALAEAGEAIRQGAAGENPETSLEAMRSIYPGFAGLLHTKAGRGASGQVGDEAEASDVASAVGQSRSGPERPPDLELGDELVEVGVMGRPVDFPEWYRPGSAPWFERGLGPKQVHPSAVRGDAQTIVRPLPGDFALYRDLWAEVQREVGFLVTRMTNLLREEAYLRYAGQFRSGTRLQGAKLWKQRMGNYRLFERPLAGVRAAAFTLLVDESASMKGQDKFKIAAKTALLLGETLTRLDVPLEIIGFTTADFEARAAMCLGLKPAYEYRTMRCAPLEHRVYKRFEEPYPAVRTRLTEIQPRHNNWDEEHLLFAYRRIRGRRERSKVLIVISDGQPNGDAEHLIRTVADVEGLGCRIIGIGIGADFVRQIYRNAIVVSDFRQLAEELMAVLARELGRGARAPAGWGSAGD